MSLGRKLPKVCHSRGLPLLQLRNSTYLNNHLSESAKTGVIGLLSCHICSNNITSEFDLLLVMKQGAESGRKSASFMDSHPYFIVLKFGPIDLMFLLTGSP